MTRRNVASARGLRVLVAADEGPSLPAFAGRQACVWTATGLERQVFLATTGRRRRSCAATGGLVATLCVLWLAGLVTGGVGFSSLPALHATGLAATKHLIRPAHSAVHVATGHTHGIGEGITVRKTLAALVGQPALD